MQSIGDSEQESGQRTDLEMISRFIIAIENGSRVMILNYPSFPKKTSPKIILIISCSIVLGGMIGSVIVLVNNKIRKRKESVSKVWENFIVLKIPVSSNIFFYLFINVYNNSKKKVKTY